MDNARAILAGSTWRMQGAGGAASPSGGSDPPGSGRPGCYRRYCWHRTAGIELPALPAFRCTALHRWHHAAGSAAVALCRRIPSSSAAATACPASRRRSPRGRSGSSGRSHAVPLLGPLRLWQHGRRRPRRGAPGWGSSWPPASAALHTKERSGAAAPLPRRQRQSAERGGTERRGAGGMHAGCTRDAHRVRAPEEASPGASSGVHGEINAAAAHPCSIAHRPVPRIKTPRPSLQYRQSSFRLVLAKA